MIIADRPVRQLGAGGVELTQVRRVALQERDLVDSVGHCAPDACAAAAAPLGEGDTAAASMPGGEGP